MSVYVKKFYKIFYDILISRLYLMRKNVLIINFNY